MIRYKLARIVDGRYLSANQQDDLPVANRCLEYKVGAVVGVGGKGIACYKKRENALKPHHIDETRGHFNCGKPIALLELKPSGKPVFKALEYEKGRCYEGGINYRSAKVLSATMLES